MGEKNKRERENHKRDLNVIIDLGKESVHDLYCDDPRAKAPTTNTKAQQQQQQRKEAQSEEETENEEAPRADATSLPNLFPYNEKPNALQETNRAFSNDSTRYFIHESTIIIQKPTSLPNPNLLSPYITKAAPNAFTGNHPSDYSDDDTRCFIQ